MLYTILDLSEVFAELDDRGMPRVDSEHSNLKRIIAGDPMRLLHFNGN